MSWISAVDWKNIIELSAAALSPIVAIGSAIIAVQSKSLARKKRDDDLFDRRYEFYRKARGFWLLTGNGAPPDSDPTIDPEDLIPLAEEADFLFGGDIAQHIMGLDLGMATVGILIFQIPIS